MNNLKLNRRLRSTRILELTEKASTTGQKRTPQTRTPTTERKKQKSNQAETKSDQTIPNISEKDHTLPTTISASAHVSPALPVYASDPSDNDDLPVVYLSYTDKHLSELNERLECLDRPHKVASSCHENENTAGKENVSLKKSNPGEEKNVEADNKVLENKITSEDTLKGQKRRTQTGKTKTERKKQKSNQIETQTDKTISETSDEDNSLLTAISVNAHVYVPPSDSSLTFSSLTHVSGSSSDTFLNAFDEFPTPATRKSIQITNNLLLEPSLETMESPPISNHYVLPSDASLTFSSLTHPISGSLIDSFLNAFEEIPPPATRQSTPIATNLLTEPLLETMEPSPVSNHITLLDEPDRAAATLSQISNDRSPAQQPFNNDSDAFDEIPPPATRQPIPIANNLLPEPSPETMEPSPVSNYITLLDEPDRAAAALSQISNDRSPAQQPFDNDSDAFDEIPPPATRQPIPIANNLLPEPSPETMEPSPVSNYITLLDEPDRAAAALSQISNDRSPAQKSFNNDSDYSELSNDKNYEPSSSYESLSESDHDLEIENECLDGSHEVPLNCCEDTNIAEKENVSVRRFSSEDDTGEKSEINKNKIAEEEILEEKLGAGKRIRERDFCFYCETFILNFARHMIRNHPAEPEVQLALSYPKNSINRKKKFSDLRKKGNYVSNSQTSFKPVKKCRFSNKTDYLPCTKCLGFYSKKQLWRHVKACDNTIPTNNAQSQAQNFLVRYVKVDKNLKETIFPRMRPDKISLVAKKDKLICMFGAQYLKTHREKHFGTVVTRKMRELAKLLVEATKLKPDIKNFEQLLKPQYYDILVHASKMVSRFNEETQKFGAPTYAMNIATSIKQCCSIALLQSCKLEATLDTASVQADLKTLSKLIEENWKFDISSQAADDLNVKKWNKTTIVPLAADLKLFKDYLCGISKQSSDALTKENSNIQAFNNLVESTYCRVLLLNRRRPGELQRLKLNDYNDHGNDSNKYEEFDKVLSATEKILVDKLKRIVIRGKRGRGVPVLFSTEMQDDINKILSVRDMYIGSDSSLLFVKAGGIAVCGYKILEKYAKACGAKNYSALTSTRLRKHLATMTQLFTMTDTELEQLATFMGHTLSVHKNNYRLPSDVYQTAKISKLLLLMEDGKADMYHGKALDEIDLNLDEEIKGIEIENDEVTEFELQEEDSSQNVDISIPEQPPLQDLINKTQKTSANKKRTLVPWTAEQKNVVTKHFKEHIKHKKPPKRAECDDLKKKYPTLLHNKDWLKIKVFIQNTYSKR